MKWLRSATLSLASLLLFVGLSELVVRLIAPDLTLPASSTRFRFDQVDAAERPTHVRDDRLGWRLAPNQSESMTTSAQGFRTPAFETRKTPGVTRIVFAGDSNPLGFGIRDDEAAYPARVARLLDDFLSARTGRHFEVINLAVDGYSSHQVRLLLEEWLPKLDPDVVCVQAAFNDYCVAGVPDAEASFARPWLLDTLESSHAYRWLRRTLLSATPRDEVSQDPVPRVSVDTFEENVRRIVEHARAEDAPVILLTTPAQPTVPLCVNEVPIEVDGGRSWVAQDRWIKERLVEAGVRPPDQPAHETYPRVVRREMERHPDWPILPFMLAEAARVRGDLVAAASWERRWRALDVERARLAAYAERLRAIARADDVHLVDIGQELRSYRETTPDAGHLFIDFVHLDPVGHVVVATAVARVLVEEVLGS